MSPDPERLSSSADGPDYRGRCWVVTDGIPGLENRCLGLAEAIGAKPTVKRVRIRPFWRLLMPKLSIRPFAALDPRGDPLPSPGPIS